MELPPLPASHARALQVLDDPGFSYGTLAALLKQDSRLGSHLVRRSNSDGPPGRGSRSHLTTQSRASAYTGCAPPSSSSAFAGSSIARDDRLEEEIRRPWHHALAGAIVAERLARQRSLGEESFHRERWPR